MQPKIIGLVIHYCHTHKISSEFIEYVEDKFPFRIYNSDTAPGHKFQVCFHLHVEYK